MEFKNKLENAGGYTCEKLQNYNKGDILHETIY